MFRRKGQSTLEYALIIAVVIAALLLMQYYVKRGFAGRMKQHSDEIGEQYDPTTYSGNLVIHQESDTRQTVADRASETVHIQDQISSREGSESIGAWEADEDLYER